MRAKYLAFERRALGSTVGKLGNEELITGWGAWRALGKLREWAGLVHI